MKINSITYRIGSEEHTALIGSLFGTGYVTKITEKQSPEWHFRIELDHGPNCEIYSNIIEVWREKE